MSSNYEFRIKFDVERERFVLLCRLTCSIWNQASEWYECLSLTFNEPYEFLVFVPITKIPNQFRIDVDLPDGIKLAGIIMYGDNIRFAFTFTNRALLEVASPVYRHWIEAVIEAGHFDYLFKRA